MKAALCRLLSPTRALWVCVVCFGVCVCVGQGLVLGIFSSSIAVHQISTGLELANLARQVGQESPGAWITGTKCHA